MRYNDIEQMLSSRGVFFNAQEYLFALALVAGEEPKIAYAIVFSNETYRKVKESEEEKEFLAQCGKDATHIQQQEYFKKLMEELQYQYKKQIQDFALHLDDIELTSSDVKKVLASFLRDRIDDPTSASVKELVDLLKMYQPYLPDDASASDFQRHFIQVHEPYNALCNNCNREISAYKGLSCVCEHCGQRYVWDVNEDRFYPQPSKL